MSLYFDLKLPRRDFTLDLKGEFEKETIGIFGHSGAGKTTLFSLLNGLERPVKGKIILNGKTIVDTDNKIFIPPHKRNIGVVFQEKLLFPNMTVKENLLFGTKYSTKRNISLEEVTNLLDLNDLLNSMPKDISGGEMQRVAIGRALLTSPQMLLLDEPFNAVDNNLRQSILPFLKRVGDEMDIPILVISHDLPDIQKLTNKIYIIDKGENRGFGNILDIVDSTSSQLNSDIINTLELYNPKRDLDIYECLIKGHSAIKINTVIAPNYNFISSLSPDEISLSNKKIENISIQNQLHGRITKIIQQDNGVLCIIDAGIKLVARVSKHSANDLNLKVGNEIFALFKAFSLKVN